MKINDEESLTRRWGVDLAIARLWMLWNAGPFGFRKIRFVRSTDIGEPRSAASSDDVPLQTP